MNRTFTRFQALPPQPPGTPPDGFPADSRQLPQWLAGLPRANPASTMAALQSALAALPALPWRAATRKRALDVLAPAVQEVIAAHGRSLRQATLPLSAAAEASARALEGLHLALAQGYRQAVAEWCAPHGAIPMFKSAAVTAALQCATREYLRALTLCWSLYRAPLPDVWLSLHRTFAYARSLRLDERRVDGPDPECAANIRQRYLQALLLALANPYALAQAEQELLAQLASAYAQVLPIRAQRPDGLAAAVAPDVDGATTDDDDGLQWLDAAPLLADLEAVLAGTATVLPSLRPQGEPGLPVTRDLAARLLQTLAASVARSCPRLGGGHVLDTVLGLGALHFHLAGNLSFEAFVRRVRGQEIVTSERAAWASGASETGWAQALPARVLDQSLTGYRMLWNADAQARIRVGELVGLSLHDEVIEPRIWLLGLIRWLRYENDGSVSAGVELLARHARAVALQAVARTAAVGEPMRAIEFLGVAGQPRHGLVASNLAATQRPRQQVLRMDGEREFGGGERVRLSEILDLQAITASGEYLLLAPTVIAAPATTTSAAMEHSA